LELHNVEFVVRIAERSLNNIIKYEVVYHAGDDGNALAKVL